MKAIGVIALILAILVGIGAGAVFAIRWWTVPENATVVADFVAEKILKDGRTVEPLEAVTEFAQGSDLSFKLMIALIVAAAVLFVIAIIALSVACAQKKKAVAAAAQAVEAGDKNSMNKLIPIVAAGVVVAVAAVTTAVVLKKKADKK